MRNATRISFNPRYPDIPALREKARRRIPAFAFDYLDGGCNAGENLERNRKDLQEIVLQPRYLEAFPGCRLETTLFGQTYAAPFGVAPVGLQGLIWPGSPEILARMAAERRLPFVLSTVSTASLETIATLTEGQAWFQYYHPASDTVRDHLLERARAAGYSVLVLLCDTPTFGYRPREIRRGLSMPPRWNASNILQALGRPAWLAQTLRTGVPRFANLEPYMPKQMDLAGLGRFMDGFFEKRMTREKIAYIRDRWPGTLVLKGVSTVQDAETARSLGLDGIIVSNHGGRQLDVGPSAISDLQHIAPAVGQDLTVMMDSGLRSGTDLARALACGAEAGFLGRAFMYGVAALGSRGGAQVAGLLETQLRQVMEQLGCPDPAQFTHFR
ncbi:alpha-hydroxy acid oxidase [Robiginitalea sp. M366]|uniref:alpha-hydroxy acid oxidase n=1 Tax=Robiginitalea aestuariiviva TaxID=3036903 RepID=UPI00240E8712|nr:alpha-hydroxy acid oxidase [Robiginitalea aestuariiviva]MDG1572177.1 alpha-hydroxy acid oxidase [Robiginitalea aestuariiviva]